MTHAPKDQRDWLCPFSGCGHAYRYVASLRKHVKTKHADASPPEPVQPEHVGLEDVAENQNLKSEPLNAADIQQEPELKKEEIFELDQ